MDPEILPATKVAEVLHQDLATVNRLFQDKMLPGRRIGEHWYTTRRQLLEYIEGGSSPPAAPPVSPSTEKRQVVLRRTGREPNSWNCGRCGILNDVERVECKVCGEPCDTPLLGYFPKG